MEHEKNCSVTSRRTPAPLVGGTFLRVWFCAWGWDGGAGGIQFGGWVDPMGLAASLNQENEWEPTLGVTPFPCRGPPIISLSLSGLPSCCWHLRERTLQFLEWTGCSRVEFDSILQRFDDINQQWKKQTFISFDWMIRSMFCVDWNKVMCQKLSLTSYKSKTAPPNGTLP